MALTAAVSIWAAGALMLIATQAWVFAVAGFFLGLALTRIVSVASLSAVAGAVAALSTTSVSAKKMPSLVSSVFLMLHL